jgi:predicted dienelactone hydrolase
LLLALPSLARADDPATRGALPVRSERFDIRVRGGEKKTFVDVRLPAGGSFARPVVLICHGWAASVYDHEDNADHLASRGMAAVLFQQPNRWSGDTPLWARQIEDALDELARLDADPRSSIFGELDLSRVALMGHSYGGAAVTMVAARDPRVKACVALAPVNQGNRAKVLEAAKSVRVPFLVVAGSSDWLATNGKYTQPIYKAAAGRRQYL